MNNYPSGWKICQLTNLVEIKASSVDKKYREGHDQIQLCNYMDVFNNATINNSITFMKSTASQKEIKDFKLIKGDVLLTKDSEVPEEIGMSSVLNENIDDLICGYHLYLLRIKNSILSSEYLCWTLRSNQSRQYFYKMANGSTRFGLNQGHVSKCLIPVPPLPEQKKISSVLTSLDEVIRTTQKQIKKLQHLKKATINELMTKGFGHIEFKESELGKIPKNWEVLNFPKIVKSSNQGVNTTTEKVTYSSSGINACRSNNIEENSFNWSDRKFVNQRTFDRLTDKVKPKLKDVLYCNIGSNLGAAAVVETADDLIITWNVLRITTDNNKVSPYFLSHLLNFLRKELRDFATESTMPFISSKALSKFKFKIPPLDEQNKISAVIDGINNNLEILKLKIYKTQYLKKSMMQDLFTGKIRVQVKR